MENFGIAIELTAASWEQWVGAALRRARVERLLASARPGRRRAARKVAPAGTRSSLLWMLAVSAAGFLLLRT